jgi:hypothetical protein
MTLDAMTDSAPAPTPVACPACGAAASGRFCPHCGASLLPRACPRCATAVRATAKFCHRCGASVSGEPDVPGPMVGATNRTPWLVLGLLLIAVISAITYTGINKNNPPAAPLMPNAGNADGSAGAPFAGGGGAGQGAGGAGNVDIASMSPEERFNRLFDRVMRSMAAGDTAAAQQFAPMAVMAYGMLPQHTADLRLHVALVQLAAGDVPAARAVADTILAQNPDHLFGYIVRAEAAKTAGDAAGVQKARADFTARVAAETARADRPEYTEHQALIDEYRKP